jgi:2-oxoisovalerate dehydrogenase E1 component
MAGTMKGLNEVVYVSAGEGTCAQGDLHEALNWASRDKLPMVFLIENNNYAISVPIAEQLAGNVAKMFAGYANLETCEVDGTDFFESLAALEKAHERARRGEGPTLIEAHVPRLQSHSISDNHLKYRSKEDIEREQTRCPIARMKKLLVKQRIAKEKDLEALHSLLKKLVDDAAEAAEQTPDPAIDSATQHTVTNPSPWEGVSEDVATGEEIFIVDALNHALDEELEHNPNMVIFGEDVAGGKGGVFTVTAGLTAKHGAKRVFNSQLAESSIVGAAVGLATRGLKPVAEIRLRLDRHEPDSK